MNIILYSERSDLASELITAGRAIMDICGGALQALTIDDDEQADFLAARGIPVHRILPDQSSPADVVQIASAVHQAAVALEADMILLASNRRGRELAGRLAQKLGGGCLTDVGRCEILDGRPAFSRNALGGAVEDVRCMETGKQVIALTPRSFAAASVAKGPGPVSDLPVRLSPSPVRLKETIRKGADAVDIEKADILVVVGQGIENKEDLTKAAQIARFLGAEVACTKPVATDRKWFSEERIIGLSGKRCKPRLALLLGVSGQVQFTVGIRDAGAIVAVNLDEKANIAYVADYLLVGDLKTFLPELVKRFSA
jgi:electron transfer flavoprotein alpha subunit